MAACATSTVASALHFCIWSLGSGIGQVGVVWAGRTMYGYLSSSLVRRARGMFRGTNRETSVSLHFPQLLVASVLEMQRHSLASRHEDREKQIYEHRRGLVEKRVHHMPSYSGCAYLRKSCKAGRYRNPEAYTGDPKPRTPKLLNPRTPHHPKTSESLEPKGL